MYWFIDEAHQVDSRIARFKWPFLIFIGFGLVVLVSTLPHAYLPHYFANRSVEFSRKTQDVTKNLKSAADMSSAILGLIAVFYEFTAAAEKGTKALTPVGRICVSLIFLIAILNIAISTTSDIAGSRIADDATKTFNDRLNAALGDQMKSLLTQLTPTLREQETLVKSTTAELQKTLKGTGETIENDFEADANKSTQNLAQVADVLEYANVPLKALDVRLSMPQLAAQISSGLQPLSDYDKDAGIKLREKIDKHCPPPAMALTGQGLKSVDIEPCKTERNDRMVWAWTRPLEHFLDPVNHLQINISVSFPSIGMTLNGADCGQEVPERCLRQEIGSASGLKNVAMNRTFDFNVTRPASEIDWYSDETLDPQFVSPGFFERDLAFPKLEAYVCDDSFAKETSELTHKHLLRFPASSEIDIVSMGFPTKDAADQLHLQRSSFYLTYRFHLKAPPSFSGNCMRVSYIY
jgi:hypothetical protein